MIIYKKLKIRDEREIDELYINDIEPLDSFGDVHFKERLKIMNNAITWAYHKNALEHKTAKLSKKVDWVIREYEEELYLIALKKDC